MRKLILLLVAFVVASTSYAQVGVIGGLTTSLDSNNSLKGINSYHVGFTGKINLVGNILALQPSLIYNIKTYGSQSVNYKSGHIQLPVQLQLGFKPCPIIRLYGIVEPFIGYQISEKVDGTSVKQQFSWSVVKDKLDYGAGFGLGFELSGLLQISARYYWNIGYLGDKQNIINVIRSSQANGLIASVAVLF